MSVSVVKGDATEESLLKIIAELLKGTGKIYYGPTPPVDPKSGDLWFNMVEQRLYVFP